MDLFFGATVEQRDGDTVGHLEGVVCDATTREVRSLVVQGARWAQGAVLLPLEAVDDADDDAVMVALADDQVASLHSFAQRTNVAPPPSADRAADLPDEPVDVPDVPPVGAATGIESIAFTPVIEEMPYVGDGGLVLGRTTRLYDRDGELGTLRALSIDDQTHRLTGLVGAHGALFPRDFAVEGDWIGDLGADAITVTTSRAEIEGLTDA